MFIMLSNTFLTTIIAELTGVKLVGDVNFQPKLGPTQITTITFLLLFFFFFSSLFCLFIYPLYLYFSLIIFYVFYVGIYSQCIFVPSRGRLTLSFSTGEIFFIVYTKFYFCVTSCGRSTLSFSTNEVCLLLLFLIIL